jgi:hypothetical protein
MAQLSDRVPIPPKDTINTNLSSATEQIMLRKFGKPGALTESCSPPNGRFVRRVKSEVDVGPSRSAGSTSRSSRCASSSPRSSSSIRRRSST